MAQYRLVFRTLVSYLDTLKIIDWLPSNQSDTGVYLTDLTFIEDGNPDRVDGLINWNKNQMTAAVITEIRFYQTPPYTYPVFKRSYYQNVSQ